MNPVDQATEQRFTEIWRSPTGPAGWPKVVNNRPLGKRYMITALSFFFAGMIMALLMRTQLIVPENTFLGPDGYNQIFTMHGSTMLFLFAVPFIEGLGLYFVPLLIGARDIGFPRLTSFGYWLYLFGGLTMYASFLFGEVPDAGWTAYTPLSGSKFSGVGLDFWLLGLSLVEIAGISAAVEIVVTILKFRAPGMAIQHMPLFIWSYLVVGVMIIFAFTPLLLASLMLEMDRSLGFRFFNVELGGSSLLWQHLFWFFGHPEVYIIFLPATGLISTIIPVFARRRIVAYPLVVAAVIIIGFVSFGLWTHHMFTAGLPDLPMLFFTAASFMIALASGVQIFAWVATLWGSRPIYSVPMLFILGFFFIFVNGGLTGVMVATMPFDWQVHDTNFVVAHFHHVLIGGAVFPFMGGLYHWLPKISGRMYGRIWGGTGCGLMFLGFNLTFLPMYVIGLLGMRRRVYTYPEELGVGTLNFLSTTGSYVLGLGFTVALLGLIWSSWRGRSAVADPWGGGTLEWSLSSPPPVYGFRRPPVVRDRYPLWNPAGPEHPRKELSSVADALDCRPTGWRATLLTDVTNARPQALQYLPGPTYLPFIVSVTILGAAVAFLAKNFLVAGIFALFSIGLVGRWMCSEPKLPPGEARELAARLDLPLLSSGPRATGWWGTIGMIAIFATILGMLIFSYFYLWLYSEQWPQGGLPLPKALPGLIPFAVLAAGGILQIVGSWAWRSRRRGIVYLGVGSAVISGLVFVAGEILFLTATPFVPTTNAYASIFFTLNGFAVLTVSAGTAMLAGCLIRLRRSEPFAAPRLQLWLQNSEMFWFFGVVVSVLVYLVNYISLYIF
ncbi:cbb3-type cytochrome c oxidase subunit I [Desulfopila inferna]|uniref:cbb3-type cytochrome c oxidase subunit I n=1 Tax=Desulfopila inferna TaxID=468528 RepID=UPI0019656962|nr:cbb3-type cytochrome c oxidase subunit I [Desulfopila inferna]MBM9606071.1 cbb3-type cytochrome c oxidase subunit I [Desulfopila inferna]